MTKRIVAFLVISLVVYSCSSSRNSEFNYTFEEKVWHMDTIPKFEFEIADSSPKNLSINVRNTISYPYQNLYLSYSLLDEDGVELESDLINFELFDEKTGKPFGQGSSIYTHKIYVLEGYSFPESGSYTVKVAQYMREIDLPEILSTGISIESID